MLGLCGEGVCRSLLQCCSPSLAVLDSLMQMQGAPPTHLQVCTQPEGHVRLGSWEGITLRQDISAWPAIPHESPDVKAPTQAGASTACGQLDTKVIPGSAGHI